MSVLANLAWYPLKVVDFVLGTYLADPPPKVTPRTSAPSSVWDTPDSLLAKTQHPSAFKRPLPPQHAPRPAKKVPVSTAHDKAWALAKLDKRADYPVSIADLTFVRDLGGATKAKLFTDAHGGKWVVKTGASPEHAENEYLTNRAYEAAGAHVPAGTLIKGEKGEALYVHVYAEGTPLYEVASFDDTPESDKVKKAVQKHFVVDAFIGGGDTVGLNWDNIVIDSEGRAVRIDVGEGGDFKARGGKKGGNEVFDGTVNELQLYRDDAHEDYQFIAPIYKGISDEELHEQTVELLRHKDEIFAVSPAERHGILAQRLRYLEWRFVKGHGDSDSIKHSGNERRAFVYRPSEHLEKLPKVSAGDHPEFAVRGVQEKNGEGQSVTPFSDVGTRTLDGSVTVGTGGLRPRDPKTTPWRPDESGKGHGFKEGEEPKPSFDARHYTKFYNTGPWVSFTSLENIYESAGFSRTVFVADMTNSRSVNINQMLQWPYHPKQEELCSLGGVGAKDVILRLQFDDLAEDLLRIDVNPIIEAAAKAGNVQAQRRIARAYEAVTQAVQYGAPKTDESDVVGEDPMDSEEGLRLPVDEED